MADEAHHEMSEDNPPRLKIIVSALAVVYVMTFLSGFLQDTPYNFLNYILFPLLFIGGIGLMSATVKSESTGMTRGFLFLTGITTTLLLIFFIGYEWSRLNGYENREASVEALLYGTTLFFGVGVIGSLVLIRRPKGLNSSQP
jgi:Cu/Ag efflux pump CusA